MVAILFAGTVSLLLLCWLGFDLFAWLIWFVVVMVVGICCTCLVLNLLFCVRFVVFPIDLHFSWFGPTLRAFWWAVVGWFAFCVCLLTCCLSFLCDLVVFTLVFCFWGLILMFMWGCLTRVFFGLCLLFVWFACLLFSGLFDWWFADCVLFFYFGVGFMVGTLLRLPVLVFRLICCGFVLH